MISELLAAGDCNSLTEKKAKEEDDDFPLL